MSTENKTTRLVDGAAGGAQGVARPCTACTPTVVARTCGELLLHLLHENIEHQARPAGRSSERDQQQDEEARRTTWVLRGWRQPCCSRLVGAEL